MTRLKSTAEHLTQRYRAVIIDGVLLVYLTVTAELAHRKLIWTALVKRGDLHPPTFYLMQHLFLRTFGEESLCLAAARYARVPSDDGVHISLCREKGLGRIRIGCDADTTCHGRL